MRKQESLVLHKSFSPLCVSLCACIYLFSPFHTVKNEKVKSAFNPQRNNAGIARPVNLKPSYADRILIPWNKSDIEIVEKYHFLNPRERGLYRARALLARQRFFVAPNRTCLYTVQL
jgi:hypothetical protein